MNVKAGQTQGRSKGGENAVSISIMRKHEQYLRNVVDILWAEFKQLKLTPALHKWKLQGV